MWIQIFKVKKEKKQKCAYKNGHCSLQTDDTKRTNLWKM